MRPALIIFGLLVVSVPAVGIDLLPDDAHFSKTVTLDLRGEALSDVAKLFTRVAEVRVRPSPDVADQKVTILVDNMPLRDVMNGLATLFGWSWIEKTDDDDRHTYYIIYDPLRKQRDADRQAALDKAWKALGAKLDSLALDPQTSDGQGSASFRTTLALRQYGSLSPDLRKAYRSGMRICYNMESPEGAWRPSQVVMDEFANAESGMEYPSPRPAREDQATWFPDLTKPSNVSIELCSAAGAGTITALGRVRLAYHNPDPSDSKHRGFTMGGGDREGYLHLCTQGIDHPSETLDSTLPNKPADGLLSKKVSVSAADLVAEGAIAEGKTGACSATRTDLLAALHKKLGLQIISDYYSSWGQSNGARGTTLKQLIEEKPLPGFPANWGWDGNVLYSRAKDIRTADSREIPNRFLRPWQAVVKRQGCRGLEELAQAAAFLSDEQREAILDNRRYLKLGDCKELDDMGGRESRALRLYGLLTPKQKKDIFTGQVGVLGMTLEQRNALAALVYSAKPDHVGVYNNDGLSVNAPETIRGLSGTPAVGLRMTCSGSFIYLKPGDDIESRVLRLLAATTPEEALLTAQKQLGEDADPQNVVALDDTVYTLTVTYEGYTADEVPGFYGPFGASAHSTCQRVRIKVPKKNIDAPSRGKG